MTLDQKINALESKVTDLEQQIVALSASIQMLQFALKQVVLGEETIVRHDYLGTPNQ